MVSIEEVNRFDEYKAALIRDYGSSGMTFWRKRCVGNDINPMIRTSRSNDLFSLPWGWNGRGSASVGSCDYLYHCSIV